MNLAALPAPGVGLPIEPQALTTPSLDGANVSSILFADLLLETETAIELDTVQETVRETVPVKPSELPAIAQPAISPEPVPEDSEPQPVENSDSAALAYAFVVTMPVNPPLDSSQAAPVNPVEPRTEVPAKPTSGSMQLQIDEPDAEVRSVEAAQPLPPETGSLEPQMEVREVDQRRKPVNVPVTDPTLTAPIPATIPPASTGIASAEPVDVAGLQTHAAATTPVSPGLRAAPAASASQAPVVLEVKITQAGSPSEKTKFERAAPGAPVSEQAPEVTEPRLVPRIEQSERATLSSDTPEQPDPASIPTAPRQQQSPPVEHTQRAADPNPVGPAVVTRPASADQIRQPYLVPDSGPATKPDSGPLKQMDLRIPDSSGEVTVRLQERAGGVHVTVQSTDGQLATNIAGGLTDLTRALDRQGFRAETWTPGEALRGGPLAGDAGMILRSQAEDSPGNHSQQFQGEQSQLDQHSSEHRQRKREWQEEQEKRPERPAEENFEEYLW